MYIKQGLEDSGNSGLGIHCLQKLQDIAHTDTNSHGQEVFPCPRPIHVFPAYDLNKIVLVPKNQPNMADLSNKTKIVGKSYSS